MKQMLRDFSNLLLVVLCDYVLGAVQYLLLEQPTHVALSNGTVSVGFRNYDGGNVTLRNISILLIEASTNHTVAEKQLLHSQYQDIVVFECFHFKSAGKYWFRMASEINNGSDSQWNEKTVSLNVMWPVFHFDLRRTSEGLGSSLQLQLFTNEYLCPLNNTVLSLEIILSNSLHRLGTLILNETVGLRTRKKISLLRSQRIKFDCLSFSQEAYVVVLLKSPVTNSVIASAEPVDLLYKFGYKLVVAAEEEICQSSVTVSVIPPPCISSSGHIAVFKDHLGPLGQKALKLHESIMNPKDNQVEFNCTLFDKGTNKYCFEFRQLNQVDSQPRAKECRVIQRNVVSWSLWQAWSPCSVTCGDGIRERSRECLTSVPMKLGCVGKQRELSPCSLEECCTTESSPITPHHPEEGQRTANNLVTVTGISLCLSIILATILITLWRKLCRTQKCSTPMNCDSSHSPGFRKNSDEENICQERQQQDSFSEAEVLCSSLGEPSDMPLNFRRSHHFSQDEGGSSINESFQSNAQKIIPPIFSYRLAQQQLKEMKKKGLTETTKLYHVSQNPLMDTVSTENQEASAANKFRIKSPFSEQVPSYPELPGNRSCSKMDSTLSATEAIWSPSQSLIRRGALRYLDNKGEPSERGYPRNSQFRRTASFHETRKAKPFRKRSMSTLTPTQTPLYHCRTRMWDCVPEEQHKPKSKGTGENTVELELYRCGHVTSDEIVRGAQNPHKWRLPGVKPHPLSSRQPVSQMLHGADKTEPKRNRSSPFLNYRDTWGRDPARLAPKDCQPRGGALSPTQNRRSKCQSFPSDPKYIFYDNTTFGLTESEQQMMDLPGYFGSSEGEISTLSIENLVI